jgi:hypothetical protein
MFHQLKAGSNTSSKPEDSVLVVVDIFSTLSSAGEIIGSKTRQINAANNRNAVFSW